MFKLRNGYPKQPILTKKWENHRNQLDLTSYLKAIQVFTPNNSIVQLLWTIVTQ